ncbi:MAG: MATE family efflux transporter [Anaerovoracaceae bacterium]
MKLIKRNEKREINKIDGQLMFSNKFLIKLLWPLFIEQFLVFAVGLVDSIMVASVGEAAVSAVSLVDSVMVLIITVMTALATGGAVVVGQFLGQSKDGEARQAGDQLILFIIMFSVFIIAVMYAFKNFILSVVFGNIEEDVMAYCNTYYIIVVASVPFIAVYNAGAALFRSVGNSQMSMKISFLMNGINVAGNAMLIYGFNRGVEGVAIPTLVSRVVAAFIVFRCLKNQEFEMHISRRFVYRPDWKLIKNILKIGVPNGVENSMFQLGKLILLSMISGFGTAAIAANAVGNAVAMIAVLPGMSVGYGIVSVISRCVGSGDYNQVRYYTKKLMKWVYYLMIAVNVIIIFLTPFILKIYGLSETTADIAGKIIIFHSFWAITIWPLSFSLPNMLRAAGDVMYTMIIGVGSMWIFRICFGIVLGLAMGFGVFGVWIAMIIDWAIRAICFIIRYRSGRWKHPAVE